MSVLFIILTIIVCVLLGFIVLIQNPKGGGLASNFSSSSQLMGVQKTGDFLEKGTWFLAIAIMVLSLVINVSYKGGAQRSGDSETEQLIKNASKPKNTAPAAAPLNLPTTPATTPAPAQKKP